MTGKKKHTSENKGAKLRDHTHPHPDPRRPFLMNAHRDWRVWSAVMLMIALMVIYVLTDGLSLRPGGPSAQPMPANTGP